MAFWIIHHRKATKEQVDDKLMVIKLFSCNYARYLIYEPIWTGYISLKKRGIKLKGVTEVTIDNIQYCKKLMEVGEIRHLDG